LHVVRSEPDTADSLIDMGHALRPLLAGELSPDRAIADGAMRITGDPALLHRFVELFTIPPAPALC
jgi:hypothetical protein